MNAPAPVASGWSVDTPGSSAAGCFLQNLAGVGTVTGLCQQHAEYQLPIVVARWQTPNALVKTRPLQLEELQMPPLPIGPAGYTYVATPPAECRESHRHPDTQLQCPDRTWHPQ